MFTSSSIAMSLCFLLMDINSEFDINQLQQSTTSGNKLIVKTSSSLPLSNRFVLESHNDEIKLTNINMLIGRLNIQSGSEALNFVRI